MEQIDSLEQTVPFVRYAQNICLKAPVGKCAISACDHRIFYVVNGEGTVIAAGETYEAEPGMLFYWPAGISYRFLPMPGKPLEMLSVNFDFTQKNKQKTYPIPVVHGELPEEMRLEKVVFLDAPVLNGVLVCKRQTATLPYLCALAEEWKHPQLYSSIRMSGLLTGVLAQLARAGGNNAQLCSKPDQIRAIIDFVDLHYTQDLSNAALAQRFGYHPNYISQVIRRYTGMSLHQYLLKMRIRYAVQLLENTGLPIGQVAEKSGFHSVSYFSKYFRQCTGSAPSAFRM